MAQNAATPGPFKNHLPRSLGWGLGLGLGLGLSLIVLVAAGLLAYAAFESPLNHFLGKCAAVSSESTTEQETEQPSRGVLSVAELRNDIIAYYNTFITILIALLGASAIIGYLHLRHISKREAEQQAHEAVDHFFSLETTHRLLDERIGNKVEEWIPDPRTITGKLSALEDKIEELAQYSSIRTDIGEEGDQD